MDKKKVYEFLKSHPVGVLATVDDNNNPHATTIYFAIDEDLTIKFMSKRDTQKIHNIENNKNIILVVFDVRSQTNVQIFGQAKDVSDDPDSNETFLDILEITRQTSSSEVPPVSKIFAGSYVTYVLNPKQVQYSVYQLHPSPNTETEFITIDFEDKN